MERADYDEGIGSTDYNDSVIILDDLDVTERAEAEQMCRAYYTHATWQRVQWLDSFRPQNE